MDAAAKANVKKPARLGDRLFGIFGVRFVVFVLAAKGFLPGVIDDPPFNVAQYHDEHYYVMHDEAARRTIVDYGQVPAWNPWHCGGMIGLEIATSTELSPEFLLRLIYGTIPGRKLTVLFWVLLGMEGTFRYARKNGASALGAMTGAVAFSCMHHFFTLLSWGWVVMFNYNLIPWVSLSYENGIRKRWWIVAGGAFMAWVLFSGGSYVVPYSTLVLSCLLVNETLRAVFRLDGENSVKWWRPLATLAGMAAVTAGVGAIKFVPLIDFVIKHPRPVDQHDLTSPLSALAMLFVGHEHAAWGQGAADFYVGWGIVVLGVVALLFADRKAAKFWSLAAFFFVLALGEFVPSAPYDFLHRLPIFSQLRFPVRMLTLTSLFAALAASRGLTRIEDLVRDVVERAGNALRRVFDREATDANRSLFVGVVAALASTGVAGAIALGVGGDVVKENSIPLGSLYNMQPPLVWKDNPFRQSRGNRWDAHVWTNVNFGTIHCFEENKVFESPYLRGDLPAEEYGAPDTDTKVERVSWSPHKIVLKVTSSGEGRLRVNQNHHPAWKTDVGTLDSDGGLISVRVPPGTHVVTIEYRDWRVRLGALVTFASWLFIAIRYFPRLRRRARAFARWWRAAPDDGSKITSP